MNLTEWAKETWEKVPATWRDHAKSAAHTFVAAFLTQASIDIAASGYVIPLEKAAIIALAASAIRAAWKALVTLLVSWWTSRKK